MFILFINIITKRIKYSVIFIKHKLLLAKVQNIQSTCTQGYNPKRTNEHISFHETPDWSG